MAVASIASWDWPENWPNLLEVLVGAIKERKDPDLVQGALRCLSMFAGEIDEGQLPVVLPVLLPELKSIVSLPCTDSCHMQQQALAIIHSFISNLGTMSGQYGQQTRELIQPHLEGLMQQFLAILSQPLTPKDMSRWGMLMEAIKSLIQIMLHFSRLVEPMTTELVSSAGKWLLNSYQLFVTVVLDEENEPEEVEVDSEGGTADFQTVTAQLFELLLVLIGNKRLQHLFEGSLKDLMYLTLGYMQMTQRQVNTWVNDPNQYLADEQEELFTMRASGELMLTELVEAFGDDAMQALGSAVERRTGESVSALSSNKPNWWKPREAALLAMGYVSEAIAEARRSGAGAQFDLGQFLEGTLKNDIGGQCPYLVGRALWMAAKLAPVMSVEQATPFAQAAVAGLCGGGPAPVRIGACRAISQLFPALPREVLKPCMPSTFESLVRMLQETSEDTQNLVLETLAVAAKVDEDATSQFESQIMPTTLQIWSENFNDPMVGTAAMDVITGLAANSQCLPGLCRSALPVVSKVVVEPAGQPAGAVESCLDLLTVLVGTRSLEVAGAVYTAVGPAVMALLAQSDDAGILESCTKLLQALVMVGGEQLLSWGGADPAASLQTLMAAVSRLLDPAMGDAPAAHVGQLVNALVQKVPTVLGPMLPDLLKAIIWKLQHVDMSQVVVSLLVVFFRLAHKDVNSLIEVLATMSAPSPDGSTKNALQLVMGIWTERYVEIQGPYSIRLATTAMGNLLASGNPKLSEVQVKGKIVPTSGGVRTRSQAKRSNPDKWVMVPLPIKIVMLFADILVEQQMAEMELAEGSDEDPKDEEGLTDSVAAGLMTLDDILARRESDFASGVDFDEGLHDPVDPVAQLDLVQYAAGQIKDVNARDPAFLQSCMAAFTPAQEAIVRGFLQKQ
eukprot:evm.model.scf_261EXC.5 EVM.evm.TU.scf_261EXC.5   scf_261EXC:60540-71115(+)